LASQRLHEGGVGDFIEQHPVAIAQDGQMRILLNQVAEPAQGYADALRLVGGRPCGGRQRAHAALLAADSIPQSTNMRTCSDMLTLAFSAARRISSKVSSSKSIVSSFLHGYRLSLHPCTFRVFLRTYFTAAAPK
jgi:hypothetical protein